MVRKGTSIGALTSGAPLVGAILPTFVDLIAIP